MSCNKKVEMWASDWEDLSSTFLVEAEGLTLEEARKLLVESLDPEYLAWENLEVVAEVNNPVLVDDLITCDPDEYDHKSDSCPNPDCQHKRSAMVYVFSSTIRRSSKWLPTIAATTAGRIGKLGT